MYIVMYIDIMSRRYSVAEARSHLPAIIDHAAAGREVELTRRGRPVVVVVSCREFDRLRGTPQHFSDAYEKFLEKFSLDEIGLEDTSVPIRDKTTGRRVSL